MAGPKWEVKKIDIGLPDIFSTAFEQFDRLAGQLNRSLEFLQTGLTAVNIFLIDGVNPLLLALEYILDQILNVIHNIQVSGVYALGFYPSAATNSNFVKFSSVIGGLAPNEASGFYTLNTTDALKTVVESLDDKGDNNRPSSDDGSVAGALMIFAGSGSTTALSKGSSLLTVVKQFQAISELFYGIFHLQHFQKYKIVLDKMNADLAKANAARAAAEAIELSKEPKSVAPDWYTKKVTTDMIPALGDVLSDIERQVQGFKDQVTDGGSSTAITALIKYIGTKIKEIKDIQTKIKKVVADIGKLAALLDNLSTFNFHVLFVPVQTGGVNLLKKALTDTTLANRPDANLQFCTVATFVGSGTGFRLLSQFLGQTITGLALGIEDSVEFEDNIMKFAHAIEEIGS